MVHTKSGKWKKNLVIGLVSVTLPGMALLVIIARAETPPLNELETARIAIAEARRQKAHIYAAELYRESEMLYDSAMKCWRKENDRLIIARDYNQVKQYAVWSAEAAIRAKNRSITGEKESKQMLSKRIQDFRKMVIQNNDFFLILPLPDSVRKRYFTGQMVLSEAEIAFRKGNYSLCSTKLSLAGQHITHAFSSADILLSDYFGNYTEWEKGVKNTIRASGQNGSYAVIIDKVAKECLVYRNGVIQHTFNIELGKNWMGDKKYSGDQATPEGDYKVVNRKEGNGTKYHKALLLDYPNEDDLRRFNRAKNSGELPRTAGIGGLIEIHGMGGRGMNWTDGCIALENDDMDILYRLVKTGTQVTIVGSRRPLHEIPWQYR